MTQLNLMKKMFFYPNLRSLNTFLNKYGYNILQVWNDNMILITLCRISLNEYKDFDEFFGHYYGSTSGNHDEMECKQIIIQFKPFVIQLREGAEPWDDITDSFNNTINDFFHDIPGCFKQFVMITLKSIE